MTACGLVDFPSLAFWKLWRERQEDRSGRAVDDRDEVIKEIYITNVARLVPPINTYDFSVVPIAVLSSWVFVEIWKATLSIFPSPSSSSAFNRAPAWHLPNFHKNYNCPSTLFFIFGFCLMKETLCQIIRRERFNGNESLVNDRRWRMMIVLATLNGQMDGWMYGRWPGHEMKNNRMHLMSDCLLCSYYGHLSYR